MFSRAAPRVAALRAVRPTARTSIRAFSKIEKQANASVVSEAASADNVPVITYVDGKRTEQSVKKESANIVDPPGADEKAAAMPFDPAIMERLTPTLRKFTLTGKVAVITGAGRGLGYNMAQAMAESGVRGIAILDQQQQIGEASAKELTEQTGVDVRFYPVDITNDTVVQQAVQDVVNHYGKIDILLNSAGIADSNMPAETYNLTRFKRLIDINLNGAFTIAQTVAKTMITSQTPGSIIFIASMSGTIVNWPQEQSCYNASKAGVVHLTRSLAAEWAKYGIRVNAISPGYMDTALNRVPQLDAQKKIWVEKTPQGRLGGVDELNNLAVMLAGDASRYMTGSNVVVDGGYTLW